MPVEVNDLRFAYSGHDVLKGVNFRAGKGELVSVLGCNGAGKSTLFRCILGLQHGFRGNVDIDGSDVRTMSRKNLASRVAYIPQSSEPTFNYTVMDAVLMGTTGTLGMTESPGKEQLESARYAMRELGIEDKADRGVAQISGGERQLVLIARALAQNAKTLIMDEPTANLDYGNQHHVLKFCRRLAEKGYTVLMSTHNPEHSFRYANKVLALKNGRIIADGTPEKVLDESLIESLYGIRACVTETRTEIGTIRSCITMD